MVVVRYDLRHNELMQDFEKVYERPKNVIERSSYKLVHEALILCNHIMYPVP